MECLLCLLYLISGYELGAGFRVSGFPYISRIHRGYIGFRTSILGTWNFLVNNGEQQEARVMLDPHSTWVN